MPNAFMAPGPTSWYKQPTEGAAGFWSGLWHGFISPVTFLISLFNPNIRIYETRNTGRWYDLGFLIGISSTFAVRTQTSSMTTASLP